MPKTAQIKTTGALPFQIPAIEHHVKALRKRKVVFNGSGTGVGKTFIACVTVRELGKKMLVVCPKSIVSDWYEAARMMNTQVEFVLGYEKLKAGSTPYGYMHVEEKGEITVRHWVWTLPKDVVVVLDEVHRCKAEESANSEIAVACKRDSIPTIMLSASIGTDPTHMKATGYCMEMHDLTDYHDWARNNGCYVGNWGTLCFSGSATTIKNLHRHIFPKWGHRITISELGKLFPKTVIKPQCYDMAASKKIDAVYKDMERQLIEWEETKNTDKGMNPLTIILRARQKVELLKVPEFVELAKDAAAEGESVAIFVNFTPTLWAIADRLKTKCVIYGGNYMSKFVNERADNIAKFQSNMEKFIVCNIRAGSVGISLHDLHGKHPRLALISPNYSAIDMMQALGRVHRAKGKTVSQQRIVFAKGTIEERICERVKAKILNLSLLNDGDLLSSEHLVPFIGTEAMGAKD